MDLVTRSDAFTPHEASIINYCHLFLGVVTLSDICTAIGNTLIPGIGWGELDHSTSQSTDHTTHQPAPAIFFWTYRQRLLRVVANADGQLYGHLGNWLQPGGALRRQWNSYYDYRYKLCTSTTTTRINNMNFFDTRFMNGCTTPWRPNDHCVPVQIHETSKDCWTLTAPPALPEHPDRPLPATTFEESLFQLPEYEQHLFASVELLCEPYKIITIFNAEYLDPADSDDDTLILDNTPKPPTTIHMVSNGSELAQKITFSWILCTAKGDRLAICSGPAFGTGSSHRAEGTGMLSAACFLHHLAQYCAACIVNPLVYTSDNLGLITSMNQHLQYDACYTNATLAPDWDLTQAIHASIQHLSSPPTFQHVKGHQDQHQKYSQLSLTAQLNVDAAEAAGAFHWSHAPTYQESVPLYPTTKVHFNIGTKTVTSHHKHHIRKAASREAFLVQCRILHGWDLPTFHTINLTLPLGTTAIAINFSSNSPIKYSPCKSRNAIGDQPPTNARDARKSIHSRTFFDARAPRSPLGGNPFSAKCDPT
jgi:hypothetical protein